MDGGMGGAAVQYMPVVGSSMAPYYAAPNVQLPVVWPQSMSTKISLPSAVPREFVHRFTVVEVALEKTDDMPARMGSFNAYGGYPMTQYGPPSQWFVKGEKDVKDVKKPYKVKRTMSFKFSVKLDPMVSLQPDCLSIKTTAGLECLQDSDSSQSSALSQSPFTLSAGWTASVQGVPLAQMGEDRGGPGQEETQVTRWSTMAMRPQMGKPSVVRSNSSSALRSQPMQTSFEQPPMLEEVYLASGGETINFKFVVALQTPLLGSGDMFKDANERNMMGPMGVATPMAVEFPEESILADFNITVPRPTDDRWSMAEDFLKSQSNSEHAEHQENIQNLSRDLESMVSLLMLSELPRFNLSLSQLRTILLTDIDIGNAMQNRLLATLASILFACVSFLISHVFAQEGVQDYMEHTMKTVSNFTSHMRGSLYQ